MLRRYRLFLVLLGVAALAGLGVALAPLNSHYCWQGFNGGYSCAQRPIDPVAGIWAAVVVYALLVGLILSARALSRQGNSN